MHEDLFSQAYALAKLDALKPKQANLRRAVSSAYFFISEGVATWQSSGEAWCKSNQIQKLRWPEYFANPQKVGKEQLGHSGIPAHAHGVAAFPLALTLWPVGERGGTGPNCDFQFSPISL